jgi:hypothetical protein
VTIVPRFRRTRPQMPVTFTTATGFARDNIYRRNGERVFVLVFEQ